jgi:GNAT superfamily N-acetyltransferase
MEKVDLKKSLDFIDSVRHVTCSGFGNDSKWMENSATYIINGSGTALGYLDEGRLAGFVAFDAVRFAGEAAFHLSGIVVSPSYQSQGFSALMLGEALSLELACDAGERPRYCLATTRNMRVINLISRFGNLISPTKIATNSSAVLLDEQRLRWVETFSPNSLDGDSICTVRGNPASAIINRGKYRRSLYGEGNDPGVNLSQELGLSLDQNDGLCVVAELTAS